MIKTFIKHLIFEKCIDVFFQGIENSFKQPSLQTIIKTLENDRRIIKTMFRWYKGREYSARSIFEKSEFDRFEEFGFSWTLDDAHRNLEGVCEKIIEQQIEISERN